MILRDQEHSIVLLASKAWVGVVLRCKRRPATPKVNKSFTNLVRILLIQIKCIFFLYPLFDGFWQITPLPFHEADTCHGTNTNQMILIEGVDPRNETFELEDADYGDDLKGPWAQGIGVFDMTALKFKDPYQAKAEAYQPAEAIQEYYRTAFVALNSRKS